MTHFKKTLQTKFFSIILIFGLISIIPLTSSAQVETIASGNWFDDSIWSSGSSPGCTLDGTTDYVVKHDVTLQDGQCTEVTVKGDASLSVVDSSELWIKSDAGLTGNGDVYVEDGSTLKVSGDFTSSGNGVADNDGTVLISGTGCGEFDTNDDATGACGDSTQPLPITLNKFEGNAHNGTVSLNWSTVSETNFSHFIIQRSNDGKNYQDIGEVEGVGNSTKIQTYTFKDNTPENGMNYYRLKAVDIDDTFEYHKVIGVHVEVAGAVKIMPNPVQGSHFQLASRIPDATMTIVDKNGQQIESFQIREGSNQIRPNQRLHSGLYIVLIKQNNQVVNRSKLIVR